MTKAKFEQHKKNIKKLPPISGRAKRRWLFWIVPVIVSIGFQLYVANMTAGEGEDLSRINDEIQQVIRQNQSLEEEITQNSSLSKIESEAVSLGLGKPENILYAQITQGTAQADVPLLGQ